ncbi:MAG: HEAT repeat domain-containing protein, partial [Gemmataceae bacterium]|nr:HEAT repeat domain-containing protein [Gemmataceae bacterium]
MNRAWVLAVGLAAGAVGCAGPKAEKAQSRSQAGEDPAADPDANATVGSKTYPDNMGPVHVSGVGLVYGLEPGSGSPATPGGWRTMLENSLKKNGFGNLKELLEPPQKTTSLVLVSAIVPPGARKDEPIDLQISLPDDSRTSSLKGGYLHSCELLDYDTTGNLRSVAKLGRPGGPSGGLMTGSVWVKTADKAAVVAGVEVGPDGRADPERSGLRAGRVWAGGRVVRPRPYLFVMKPGDANIRTTAQVAERLNSTFGGGADPSSKVAEVSPQQKLVLVHVPYAYRHNHTRFLVVSRLVPMTPAGSDSPYRRELEDQLLDPATAVRAAVKLEALGGDAKRALRVGLESPSPWVRFAAAESLAYLGHADGAGELARLAEDHPALRAQCLLALAATDDAATADKLVELMGSPDPQLRYGAFVALRLADDRHPALAGRQLNHSLWVHRVAPGSAGMVHLATDRRSEVVVFGDGVRLRGPLPPFPLGDDYTASVPDGGTGEVKLTRIVRVNGELEVKEVGSPPDLAAVLASLARLGGGHPEAVA